MAVRIWIGNEDHRFVRGDLRHSIIKSDELGVERILKFNIPNPEGLYQGRDIRH